MVEIVRMGINSLMEIFQKRPPMLFVFLCNNDSKTRFHKSIHSDSSRFNKACCELQISTVGRAGMLHFHSLILLMKKNEFSSDETHGNYFRSDWELLFRRVEGAIQGCDRGSLVISL